MTAESRSEALDSDSAERGAAEHPHGDERAPRHASNAARSQVTVIRPLTAGVSLHLRELWEYRELLYFLVWRDVTVRYKQTVLGVAWAILQPLLTMVVFSLFFGRLAHVPSDGVPYPIFALAALVPWALFSNGVAQASNSLIADERLITKVYFPRLAIPLATVASGLVDFLLASLLFVGMMAWYGFIPGATALWVPAFVVLELAAALGTGLWLSALNVQYRDVRYVVPFLTQLWLLATPIAYPSGLLREPWRSVYGLNPMAGVVEGFRWAMLGTPRPSFTMLALSVAASLALLMTGARYFRRMERTFADIV